MPSLSSLPLLRPRSLILLLRPPLSIPSTTSSSSLRCISAASRNPRNPPSKNLIRARDSAAIRDLSSLSPNSLSSLDPTALLPNQAIGLVAAAQANFMRVVVQSPGREPPTQNPNPSPFNSDPRIGDELLCVVRALLKKIKRRVLVGDKVLVGSVDWNARRGMIEDVFERDSEINDPPVANVDHMLVMFAMDQPKLEPFVLTRFLVEAESSGIPLTLVLNKAELVAEETLFTWKVRLHSWGYKPLFCSVSNKSGLAALEDILKRQTTVIVGPSGVGKSSLINILRSDQTVIEEEDTSDSLNQNGASKWLGEQRVNTVSKRSGQGKHTTRNVSLLPLSGGGYLCDTPGFNQPSLLKVTKRSLADAFPEIRQILSANEMKCAFNDCLHLGELGCAVKADWERYPYYFQLLDEIKIREEFQLRTFGTKRESDVRYKMGEMGVKQAEPRLELKKHRKVSRKRLNQSLLDDLEDDILSDFEEGAR